MDTSTLPVVAGSSSGARTGSDPVRRVSLHAPAAGPTQGPGRRDGRCYRYWPVLLAVSIARPDSAFLPVTRVRM